MSGFKQGASAAYGSAPVPLVCTADAYLAWEVRWAQALLRGEAGEVPKARAMIRRQRAALHAREAVGMEALTQRFGLSAEDEVGVLLLGMGALAPWAASADGEAGLQRALGDAGAARVKARLRRLGWLERGGALLGDVLAAVLGHHTLDARLWRAGWLQPTGWEGWGGDALAEAPPLTLLSYESPDVEQLAARWLAGLRGCPWLLTLALTADDTEEEACVLLDVASRSAQLHGALLHVSGVTAAIAQRPRLDQALRAWVITQRAGGIVLGVEASEVTRWEGVWMGDDRWVQESLLRAQGREARARAEVTPTVWALNQDAETLGG